MNVGIITISDRASIGEYDDLGGPALKQAAEGWQWTVVAESFRVGPDLPESCGKRAVAPQEWRLRLQ